MNQAITPTKVRLNAGNDTLAINWSDGHESRYLYSFLRGHCPCATCAGEEGESTKPPPASPLGLFKETLRPERVEVAGRYALQIFWNDGHSTGLYTFSYLRGLCPCAECAAAREERTPEP